MLRTLTGSAGYCAIHDPEHLVAEPLRHLAQAHRRSEPAGSLMARGLALQTLAALLRAAPVGPNLRRLAPRTDPEQALVARVSAFLEAHPRDTLRVADLAAAAGMSVSAFAHAYRRAAGETPYRAILRARMNAARRLLLLEGLNVQETANRLGFSSPCNLSRAFKRIEGCAPPPYCRKIRLDFF